MAEASLARSTLLTLADRFSGRETEIITIAAGVLVCRLSGDELVVATGDRRWQVNESLLIRTLRSVSDGDDPVSASADLVVSEDSAAVNARFAPGVLADDSLHVLSAQFPDFLANALSCSDSPLWSLPLGSAEQLDRVVREWNDTRRRPYPACSALALFLAHTDREPDHLALVTTDGVMTRGSLRDAAITAAQGLRARGVGDGDVVGVVTGRDVHAMVAMVAVALAGATCLPLDPAYPVARLTLMLAASQVRCVLVPSAPPAGVEELGVPTVLLGELGLVAAPLPLPDDPPEVATLLYTSGSTGVPKGVEVTHLGILRLVTDDEYIDFTPDDIVLHYAPATFDASLIEIWGALARGAVVAVAPPGPQSLDELSDFVRDQGVTVAWMTAGLFHQFVEFTPECFAGMRRVIAGGDVLSAPHVRALLEAYPGIEVVNGYGPTENGILTTCHLMRSTADPGTTTVPIGRPIRNTQVYVVDRYGSPLPPGVPGELWVAGDGLASGYTGQPSVTAERFVTPATGPLAGIRMYRTGDRARWRPDGVLEFAGRDDQQVKVNGFRIELGEVETAIGAVAGVEQVCVLPDTDAVGGKRLCAFVVGDGEHIGGARGLRASLRAAVPDFLVPHRFVFLDRFPLTTNGKVDRARLLTHQPKATGR